MKRAIAAILIAGAVAGCRVDHAKETAVYRDVLEPNHAGEPLSTPAPEEAVTLRQVLQLANRLNEQLAAQGEAYLRTHIDRQRAVANFLPTVDLVGSTLRRDAGSSSGGDGGSSSSAKRSLTDVSAELNVNVFNGFRDVNRYWQQTWIIDQARHDLLNAQESLLLDVARIYYRVLRSEAQVQVLENSLTVQQERLRDTRGRFEAGLSRLLDVAQTEAQVAATRALLIDARNDVQVARSRLVLLSGAPLVGNALNDAFDVPTDLPHPDTYVQRAETTRDDLRAAESAIAAARRGVEVAFGQYYPSVSLDLNAFIYRETAPTNRDWEAALVGGIPIFAAGRIHADVREAWSFLRQALLVREYVLRQVRQDVRSTYASFDASEARLIELRTRLDAAEQAFRQADASYQAGLATNLDRVQAQDALLSAQLALTSERFDRKILYLELLRNSGSLHEIIQQSGEPASVESRQ